MGEFAQLWLLNIFRVSARRREPKEKKAGFRVPIVDFLETKWSPTPLPGRHQAPEIGILSKDATATGGSRVWVGVGSTRARAKDC